MTAILRRPVPRFCVWAAILIGVAAATAAAGLAWWLIALVELVAWAVVTLVERALWRASLAPARAFPAPAQPVQLAPAVEAVRVLEPGAAAAPGEPEPEPAAAPSRRLARQPKAGPPAPAIVGRVRWNVWSLEKLAREHPEAEELEFMAMSLRDFADADGHLPAGFDPLVRESFGDLLPG